MDDAKRTVWLIARVVDGTMKWRSSSGRFVGKNGAKIYTDRKQIDDVLLKQGCVYQYVSQRGNEVYKRKYMGNTVRWYVVPHTLIEGKA